MGEILQNIKRPIRRLLHAVIGRGNYKILSVRPNAGSNQSWGDPQVAENQDAAFIPLIDEMKRGHTRADFLALAEAVRKTELRSPFILELGCGSGWNVDVLRFLATLSFEYTGLDCSPNMIEIARKRYPSSSFHVGDATATGLPSAQWDIVVSGTVLMHLHNYEQAIAECIRLSKQWCVFHTVPITGKRATTFLEKNAYGRRTVEIIFNEAELRDLFQSMGLKLHAIIPSLEYDLFDILREHTSTKTYVCSKILA